MMGVTISPAMAAILLLLLTIITICMILIAVSLSRQYLFRRNIRTVQISASSPEVHTSTATLLKKIDARSRVIDEYNHSSIHDKQFELLFRLKDGETLRLRCSEATYKEMPFRQTGIITYSGGKLMKFKSAQNMISDEYAAA